MLCVTGRAQRRGTGTAQLRMGDTMRNTSLALLLAVCTSALAGDLEYKTSLTNRLVAEVPQILKSFDPATGRFGSGIWICRDQHPMYPLAVAYTTKADENPYYHDPELLALIVKAGDPLLENMDERGQWIFAKKDGSTWGKIWMPWTYSRWVRTFQLIADQMPEEARKKCSRKVFCANELRSLVSPKVMQHTPNTLQNSPPPKSQLPATQKVPTLCLPTP